MDFDSDSSNKSVLASGAPARPRGFSYMRKIESMTRSLSPFERLALYIFTALLGISTLTLLAGANSAISVVVPSRGGSLTEGVLSPARFVNPLIPMSQADSDVAALVYSGLMRSLPDGSLVPDLAESYIVSDDGISYTFTLREDASFHDGEPLTSADILFTVQRAQNPDIKSTHRADWEGVSISTPDERTVIFKLPRAYAPFIHNTTMGILPKHLWDSVTAEEFPFSPLNTHPIGSGPFMIAKIQTSSTGSVTRYDLKPFGDFALGKPYLSRITFKFYPNEEDLIRAFDRGDVDAVAGISASQISSLTRDDINVRTVALPRIFGVFFNQGRSPSLANTAVRKALDQAIDKDRLVRMILSGYGVAIDSPTPPHIFSLANSAPPARAVASTAYTDESISEARDTLERGGWTYNAESNSWSNSGGQQISFTLATADTPELKATADAIAAAWNQLGVMVQVQVFPISELNTSVIRPREYDAILFGEIVGRELDVFAFWHSSQRNDPGLNLALYTNSRADTLLSQARAATSTEEREQLYEEFSGLVEDDAPAVFLYSPEFIYAVPAKLGGVNLGLLTSPAERFLSAHTWYTDTEKVWGIFANQN